MRYTTTPDGYRERVDVIIDDELLPPEEYDAGLQFIELAKTLCVDSGGHYVGATVERLEELAAALMRVAEARKMGNDRLATENLLAVPTSQAIDEIYNEIDDLLLAGDFGAVNYILRSVEVDALPPVLSIGFLSISFAARSRLDEYEKLFGKIEESLSTDPDRERLLCGLEPVRRGE